MTTEEPAGQDDQIVGVRFVEAGAVSYCNPGALALGIGDYVVVRTDRGERLAWVVIAPDQVLASELDGPRRVIDRIASEADVSAWQANLERAQEDSRRAQALAARSDPRVRVASLEYDLAREFAHLTFSSAERVDYDWLGRQVGELLGCDTLVERVGDRDRAKSMGGLGVCGRALCCATWQTEFPTISIKMAKEQDLSPNPSKISGVCGRLLCCLSYEVEAYRELRGDLPQAGKRVSTPIGHARVLSVNVLKQVVRLRFDQTGEVVEMSADDLGAQYGTAVRPLDLEETFEQPIRDRDQARQDNLLAVVTPVQEPPQRSSDQQPADEGTSAAGGEGQRRRRRRGRRGGRRRNRGDGSAPQG